MNEVFAGDYRRVRPTNATDSSFPSRVFTATEPSGTGVFNLGNSVLGHQGFYCMFFGTGDADDVLIARILGWRRIGSDPETNLWACIKLAELTVTLGTATGVAGRIVVATELIADTIVLVGTSGVAGDDLRIVSPADNTMASVYVGSRGCQKGEIVFDDSTGSPTGMNALIAMA